MKIVIVGHAASPARGSEPGQSWDWAWYLSQRHDVWLVHFPEFRSEVESYLEQHPNPRLRMVWVHTPSKLDPWDPNRSSTGAKFKIHYFLWLAGVQRTVKALIGRETIDIVHQVGLITISAPSKLWRLPVPFIWGPIGGGETAPAAFRGYYGPDWGRERNRRLRLRLIGHLPPLRNAVRRARYLFAVNRETQAALIRAGADPQRLAIMLDNGVRPQNLRAAPRQVAPEGMLRLLWVGRLEARKALTILLDAMALAADGAAAGLPAVTLQVAGEGPKRSEWEADARKLGLGEAVTFLGAVPPAKMAELYDQADVFVFTSLQDAFGSVVMESLTRALPAIVLNHQGCATVVPDDAAIKIPVTTPRETVAALAAAIDDVRRRPEQLVPLSERALAAARDAQWPNRAAIMTNIYEQVLAGRQSVAPTLQPEPCAA